MAAKSKDGPRLPDDQAKFLAARLKSAARRQPEIGVLRRMLLDIKGLEFVPPPGDVETQLRKFISEGRVFNGPIEFRPMDRSQCHQNVSKLWLLQELHGICTGYGLSSDGLWRQHSWGLAERGIYLETTELRTMYFGVLLAPSESDVFARAALSV